MNNNIITSKINIELIEACQLGLANTVLELIKSNNKLNINYVDSFGNTALIWTCINKMNNIALELIKLGALDNNNIFGNSALYWAQRNEMNEVYTKILNINKINIIYINKDKDINKNQIKRQIIYRDD